MVKDYHSDANESDHAGEMNGDEEAPGDEKLADDQERGHAGEKVEAMTEDHEEPPLDGL
jgi:hypothetical protein